MGSKKFFKIVLSSIMIVTLFLVTGCSALEMKELRIGMSCCGAPYNWAQPDNDGLAVNIVGSNEYAYGYDVIIAKKLAAALGAELKIYRIEWDGLAPAILTGKIDAAIDGISITSKRKETVDFTIPYYYANVVALVRKDSVQANAQSVEDLSGSVATSMLNTIWYDHIDQIPNVKKLAGLDIVPAMLVALKSRRCDVVLLDIPTARAAEYSNPELKMVTFAEGKGFKSSKEDVDIGVALKKGNTELLNAMNEVLGTLTDADRTAILDEAIKAQPLAKF